ncbi:MAG: hypothetical protein ACD_79C01005G0001 [uncultured bacterium]|nr:MAG: hypothetical protein ACD_79C01005G0001 [uncultured bacterium]
MKLGAISFLSGSIGGTVIFSNCGKFNTLTLNLDNVSPEKVFTLHNNSPVDDTGRETMPKV